MRNRAWERWGGAGIGVGALLLVFGLLLQSMEIARIFRGPLNLGSTNFSGNPFRSNLYGLESPGNAEWINQQGTMWPWTSPGLFLGILAMVAGVLGCVASRHKTYGSILGFSILSLITAAMSVFTLTYYSFIVHLYNTRWNSTLFNDSDKLAGRISRALLAFTLFTMLAALLAVALSARAIGACKPKGRARRMNGPRMVGVPRYPMPRPF